MGDRVLVASGEKVPVDGRILDGATQLDTSLITGESVPRAFGEGDTVYAGCVNLGPSVQMQVIAMADDSLLADIARLMEDAQQSRDRFVRLADKAAKIYAPLVHTLGALTVVGWLIAGAGIEQALITAIAVLIITCPCALGLAVPAVQVVAAGRLFRRGVLVKNGAALERFAEIDRVVFDKTGTLTLGVPSVTRPERYSDENLRAAAALAAVSRHPLSRAIVDAAAARLGPLAAASGAHEIPGAGIEADGARLGSAASVRTGRSGRRRGRHRCLAEPARCAAGRLLLHGRPAARRQGRRRRTAPPQHSDQPAFRRPAWRRRGRR